MKIEDHEKAYEEHVRNLKNLIEKDLVENQRNIAYNTSQGSIELFAIFLHKLNFIQGSGDQFDHRIFKNKRQLEIKIPPEFPEKTKILELMRDIETSRNLIGYGKRKPTKDIEKVIERFNELRKIINILLGGKSGFK